MFTTILLIFVIVAEAYLITAKVQKFIDWPWWQVLAPTIIVVSGFVIVMAFVLGHWWTRG